MDVARVIPMMIMNIVLPLALQLYDRRRLDEAQRARSWNFATWGSVLVWLGPLSMLGWIFVTRRRWWRCLIAPLWTLPLLIVTTVADMSLQAARGEELELETTDSIKLAAPEARDVVITLVPGFELALDSRFFDRGRSGNAQVFERLFEALGTGAA